MTRSRRNEPLPLFPSPSTEGSAWFQARRARALDRPAVGAHLRCLMAVPDFVAERCAECGAPFNRPLGSDLDRCAGCAHASMVPAERLEEEEGKLKALQAEYDELEEAREKIERNLATASDRVHDLEVILRDVRQAFATEDPLARMLGMEISERIAEVVT